MDTQKVFSGMRKTIAKRMRMSLDTAAQASHRIKIDMTALIKLRAEYNEKHPENKISVTDIIIWNVVKAILQNSCINSSLQDKTIVTYEHINMGVAVAIDNGLIVPVIKNCDEKTVQEISSELKQLVSKVKEKKFTMDDISGGTFTITNLGMYGIDSFTAIINPPEAAILAIGATKKIPVVINNEIAIRNICEYTITYDHRILDGAPVAKFLYDLQQEIENITQI